MKQTHQPKNHQTENTPKPPKETNGKIWLFTGRFRVWKILGFATIVLVVLGGAGFFYAVKIAPFRKVVLTMDSRITRMDYLLKRTRMSGSNPSVMLQQLAYEQVVENLLSPQYNISVNSSEIDNLLRSDAASAADTASDADFRKWYAGQLKSTSLSDAQYRKMVEVRIMAGRLLDVMGTTIPPTAEQVHVYVIVTPTPADAEKARSRIAAGENFTAVASEISVDSQTKTKGGDIGWVPRGVTGYDDTFFDLAPGEVSTTVALNTANPTTAYAIFTVTEKDPDRQIEPAPLQSLKSKALYTLIQQQISQHVIFTYSEAEHNWANKQLAIQP